MLRRRDGVDGSPGPISRPRGDNLIVVRCGNIASQIRLATRRGGGRSVVCAAGARYRRREASQARAKGKVSLRTSASTRIAIGSTLFALASSAFLFLVPPSPIDRNVLRGAFRLYKGYAYLIPVKYVDGTLETARLYEDDRLLGPANTAQQEIIDKGAGRFAFYRDTWNYFGPALMFSTSDNTDPNTNGRKYHLR
ncbi:hypothetical protein [Bradyrhizobium brasilense]|uniref:hypothetical protein n=1 Tax=Bradyrhizobium brasilense TaxID=1419277 RepID=UPI001F234C1B|nr:hypothetical protein [Bradyrhizobium brasilense]